MDLISGTIPVPPSVGDYQILKPLGEGAMGAVFLGAKRGARDFKRMVALKRVKPSPSADIAFDKRLVKEAHIGACLEHPNVVTILDLLEEDDGDLYLVMEYVDGLDLRAWMDGVKLTGAQLPAQLSVQVIIDVCTGLDYLHNATDLEGRPLKLIHRDLKPSNILVSRHGQVKIVDFGIARANLLQTESLTGPDNMVGTMRYMSPEQARGETALDHRTDLFSAAVILYELLTLEHFYEAYTPGELLARAQRADVQPKLAQLPTDLLARPQLSSFLEKALQVDRQARFQSALEMASELSDILAGMPRVATLRSWLMPGFFPSNAESESKRHARDVSLTGEQSLVSSRLDAAAETTGEGVIGREPSGVDAARRESSRDGTSGEEVSPGVPMHRIPEGAALEGEAEARKVLEGAARGSEQSEQGGAGKRPGLNIASAAPAFEQTIEERCDSADQLEKTEADTDCRRSRLARDPALASSEEDDIHAGSPRDARWDTPYAEDQRFDRGQEIFEEGTPYESTLAEDPGLEDPQEIRLRDLLGLEWPDDTVGPIEPAPDGANDYLPPAPGYPEVPSTIQASAADIGGASNRFDPPGVEGLGHFPPPQDDVQDPSYPSDYSAREYSQTPVNADIDPEVTKPLPERAAALFHEPQHQTPPSLERIPDRIPEPIEAGTSKRIPDRVPDRLPDQARSGIQMPPASGRDLRSPAEAKPRAESSIRLPLGISPAWLISAALTIVLVLFLVMLSYQSVRIVVFPNDADVLVDGRPIVVGDGTLTLGFFSKHTLTFRHEGYQPEDILIAPLRRLPTKIVMELVPSTAPRSVGEHR